ncbi:hypothetical protein CDAR_208601 [Caerostris darwini]|uniref:Uncharacterized protein n=1 Tax=Caerostris darwini TaxID=1538125 RepID=A0AAV4VPW7_9ARAC|nr:hypothetical protein CDAR_208601 [Caerostris darwini]
MAAIKPCRYYFSSFVEGKMAAIDRLTLCTSIFPARIVGMQERRTTKTNGEQGSQQKTVVKTHKKETQKNEDPKPLTKLEYSVKLGQDTGEKTDRIAKAQSAENPKASKKSEALSKTGPIPNHNF